MVLRKISGPKNDQVTRGVSRLHNKEIYDLYSLSNIIRVTKSTSMRWVGHVCMGERRGTYRISVGRPE